MIKQSGGRGAGFNIRAVAPVAVTGVSAMASGKSGGDNADLVSVRAPTIALPGSDSSSSSGATLSATSLQMPSNAIHLTWHKKEEWADKDNQPKEN